MLDAIFHRLTHNNFLATVARLNLLYQYVANHQTPSEPWFIFEVELIKCGYEMKIFVLQPFLSHEAFEIIFTIKKNFIQFELCDGKNQLNADKDQAFCVKDKPG